MRQESDTGKHEPENTSSIAALREESLRDAARQIFEQLPAIIKKVLKDAEEGNPAMAKVILDVVSLRDALQAVGAVSDADVGLLDAGLLERLSRQIEAMPDNPDPRSLKW